MYLFDPSPTPVLHPSGREGSGRQLPKINPKKKTGGREVASPGCFCCQRCR